VSFEKRIVVDFSDLRSLVVPCQKCGSKIVLDASNDKSELPEACPSCRVRYGFDTNAAYRAFREAYMLLSKQNVQVEVVESDTKNTASSSPKTN